MVAHRLGERHRLRHAHRALALRIAREHRAVGAQQRRIGARRDLVQPAVELLEIIRPHRNLHDAGEAAVGGRPPLAHAEEVSRRVGIARLQHLADEGAGIDVEVRPKIIAVGEAHRRRRMHQRIGKRAPVAVEDPHRLELRQRLDQQAKPQVQVFLVSGNVGIGHAAHDLVRLRDRSLDRFEHLRGVFLEGERRALDAVVRDRKGVPPVHPAGIAERQRGQHHDRHHRQPERPDRRRLPFPHSMCAAASGRTPPARTRRAQIDPTQRVAAAGVPGGERNFPAAAEGTLLTGSPN
jgi:hypothetical protein